MKKYSKEEITEFCKFLRDFHESCLENEEDIDCLIEAAIQCLYRRLKINDDISFHNTQSVFQYLNFHLAREKNEVFAVLFLDSKNRIIKFEKLFSGTVSHCLVYPRVIVQKALKFNAVRVILAHNHPSGINEPSDADIALTEQLKEALSLFDIEIIDHIIIGNQYPISLAEQGYRW